MFLEEANDALRAKGLNPRLRFSAKGTLLTVETRVPFGRVLEEIEKSGARVIERGTRIVALLDNVEVSAENGWMSFLAKGNISPQVREKIVGLAASVAG